MGVNRSVASEKARRVGLAEVHQEVVDVGRHARGRELAPAFVEEHGPHRPGRQRAPLHDLLDVGVVAYDAPRAALALGTTRDAAAGRGEVQ